ncbi:FHA domain-containing protein, partial [Streptomyces prasinus]|uniref:FHA domain-containing protein n=1 Tax=Streptomyces prasinus TaxID=67345 RepID=UPI001F0B0D37
MQIRLTVVDPLGLPSPARGHVVVTAPAGTALAAVAAALVSAVSGGDGSSGSAGSSGTPVLYAGDQRLDAQRCTLGEPPLIDGAVLAVGAPGEPEPHPELDDTPTRLHVVAGPDAGGVHLLHGGEIRIGRSADADVPLDDPDVSRLHCAVTVGPDGRVSVADLGSTNGTTLDGRRVGSRPVGLAPGALLRIGESVLRLTPAAGPEARARTTPDGEGHVRVPEPPAGASTEPPAGADTGTGARAGARSAAVLPLDGSTHHGYGSPGARTTGELPLVPGQGGAPGIESHGTGSAPYASSDTGSATGSGSGPDDGFGPGTGFGFDSGDTGRSGSSSSSSSSSSSRRTVHAASRDEAPRVPKGRRVSQLRPADGGSDPASGTHMDSARSAGTPTGSGAGDGSGGRARA